MRDPGVLKRIIADMFGTRPEAIDAGFPLRHPRLQSSAGRGVLAAAIHRQIGVYSPKVFTATRYGELEAAIFGTPAPDGAAPAAQVNQEPAAAPAAASTEPAGIPGVRVGVDVEMVESMPEAADFWAEPFYRSHFTPAEIAYCLRQEQPRMHFAARWCAKEALAKCDGRFAGVDPATIQVIPQGDGQPVLEVVEGAQTRRIDVAVSLSHTPLMAIAVVAAAVRSVQPPAAASLPARIPSPGA